MYYTNWIVSKIVQNENINRVWLITELVIRNVKVETDTDSCPFNNCIYN